MHQSRRYGREPYTVVVVHGGPGAAGEMATVARELSSTAGVLEPLLEADSVTGQVEELKSALDENATMPVTLIGFSWGAWLSTMLAARHPRCVRKLVLVSSGPFEGKDAVKIMETRLARLTMQKRMEAESLLARISGAAVKADADLERFGELMSIADSYDPLPQQGDPISPNMKIYDRVWSEASKIRASGELLRLARQVQCPVLAIHGDYDPHPAACIQRLGSVFNDFRFVLLEKCGHRPWQERHGREKFMDIIRAEVG